MSAPLPCDGTGRRLLAVLADEGLLDKEVARWCGVDPSLVAHWRSGARGMPAWAVVRVARRLEEGARLRLLDELLAPLGCHAVPDGASSDGDPMELSIDAAGHVVAIQRTVAQAQADGVTSIGEAAQIHRLCTELGHMLGRLSASSAREVRVAR